jgi:glycosyltransferase involved in cell wall biosynthesis
VKLYGCPSEKIEVIWHGVGRVKSEKLKVKSQSAKFKINKPYFLYLGRIELKKNVLGILEAFEKFKIQNSPPAPSPTLKLQRARRLRRAGKFKIQDHKLVLAGGRGYGWESVKLKGRTSDKMSENLDGRWKSLKCKEDIIFTGHVEGERKWELLRNATALVFPSFYEGFGLPILEAQSVGVPVITSKGSSMEEITTLMKNEKLKGKNDNEKCKTCSALLVDPNRPEEIAEAMGKIINNQKLRDELIRLGYENVKRFSWEKTAMRTLRVLTQIDTNNV